MPPSSTAPLRDPASSRTAEWLSLTQSEASSARASGEINEATTAAAKPAVTGTMAIIRRLYSAALPQTIELLVIRFGAGREGLIDSALQPISGCKPYRKSCADGRDTKKTGRRPKQGGRGRCRPRLSRRPDADRHARDGRPAFCAIGDLSLRAFLRGRDGHRRQSSGGQHRLSGIAGAARHHRESRPDTAAGKCREHEGAARRTDGYRPRLRAG